MNVKQLIGSLFFFLFCSFALRAQEQSYQISGIVQASETGEQLIGAMVALVNENQTQITNENGYFQFDELQPGTYQLQITYLGRKEVEQEIKLLATDQHLTIALEESAAILATAVVSDSRKNEYGIQRLRQVEASAIYASKKNELITIEQLTINKASNNSRQIYAKVSGLNIWESDGAGVQLGIGGRGLSPNRNSNFNTRQNGYDISADALGYPESYYTPPVEAIERIEVVRGAASLQYGTQFGGMLNFKFKRGPKDKKISVNSRQSLGSYGFFSSFNSLGGTVGKVNYYGFYQYKRSGGWRPNSSLNQHTAYFSAKIDLTDQLTIQPEFTHTHYLAQQAGGLTDAQFNDNPRQSNRSRNWFAVDWNLFALTLDWRLTERLRLNSRTFGLLASRDALGNLGKINVIDDGGNRDFLSDNIRNWGNETRLLCQYSTFGKPSTFLIGTRYYTGNILRKQGEGNNGDQPDFVYLNPDNLEGSNFDLPSNNISLFAENVFNLSEKWSITPGIRFEFIDTKTDGYYRVINKDLAGNIIFDERVNEQKDNKRSFAFFGLGSSFKLNPKTEIYANFSQNYRAINFNDIRVNIGDLVVDENLKDERGFNLDLGFRGRIKKVLDYDISLYYLSYQDRIGNILKKEPNPVFNNLVNRVIRFRANIADAQIYGLESLLEWHIIRMFQTTPSDFSWSIFTNLSLTRAKYVNAQQPGVEGNDVELVPPFILRTGFNFRWKKLKTNVQYAFVKSHFSDASNAERSPSAIEGRIPSYQILDFSLSYQYKFLTFETGINNVLDEAYFTRRASGYPGPGIIPSDGRSFYFTFGVGLF